MTTAEPKYLDVVKAIVETRSALPFTVNDLEDELSAAQIPPSSIGRCMSALAEAGVIRDVGWVRSRKASRRGSRLVQWRRVAQGRAA